MYAEMYIDVIKSYYLNSSEIKGLSIENSIMQDNNDR